MKCRKWSIAIVLCLLVAFFALPAHAAENSFVFDEVGLLTPEEVFQLEDMAGKISAEYGCGVYIVTMWDYTAYGSTVRSAAENYFTANDLGIGSDDNGVMLLLSMMARDYALIAHGHIANTAFTDYGKDAMSESMLSSFRYDDWPGGLTDYVIKSGIYLNSAAEGKPVDVGQDIGIGMTLVMILLIPALIAGIACALMAASMKTAKIKTQADDYRKEVQITGSQDNYITRTVVRQKIESSSSSRGGGTKVNSSGFSGKSGKF